MPGLLLLSIALFGLIVFLHVRQHRAGERLMQRSFESLGFPLEGERLPAHEMKVVRRVIHETSRGSGVPITAFWYCIGPGPSYFVAIAQYVRTGWRGGRYHWVVNPIDETRMHGALADDQDALHAVFGDHAGGTLRA